MNLLLTTESSKISEYNQFPPKTEKVYCFLEAALPAVDFYHTVFFGLQYYLIEYLQGKVITEEKIQEADEIYTALYGSFNKEPWEYILKEHDGNLPIKISALPEGASVARGNALLTVENTDPKCYWLPSFLESFFLKIWYPTTVATLIRTIKAILIEESHRSGDHNTIDSRLQDFSFNSASSFENAGLATLAYLINFKINFNGLGGLFAKKYYQCKEIGYAYPVLNKNAHSTWNHPQDSYINFLDKNKKGMVSTYADDQNIHADTLGRNLKTHIVSRNAECLMSIQENLSKNCADALNSLQRSFGTNKNHKGQFLTNAARILAKNVNFVGMNDIIRILKRGGWSGDNIYYTLTDLIQKDISINTCNFKYENSHVVINGIDKDISRNGKRGRLKVIFDTDTRTIPSAVDGEDLLVNVFENGKILKLWDFDEVKYRSFIE